MKVYVKLKVPMANIREAHSTLPAQDAMMLAKAVLSHPIGADVNISFANRWPWLSAGRVSVET